MMADSNVVEFDNIFLGGKQIMVSICIGRVLPIGTEANTFV
jgi:hypothetical protein